MKILLKIIVSIFAFSMNAGADEMANRVEKYFKPPQYFSPRISEDGRNMVLAVSNGGRMNLAVIELANKSSKLLTSYKNLDVIDYHWVGNNKVVFSLGKFNTPTGPESQDGGGLFVINIDGTGGKVLSPTLRESFNAGNFVYRGMSFQSTVQNNDDEIIVAARERSIDTIDLYRLNIASGKKELLTQNSPGKVEAWIIDSKQNPVLATSLDPEMSKFIVRHLDRNSGRWNKLWESDLINGPVYMPLRLDSDDNTLFVATNKEGDTVSVYEFDLKASKFRERLARHPQFDVGADQTGMLVPGLVYDEFTKELMGVRVNEQKLRTYWFSPDHRAIQSSVDNQLKGRVNLVSMPRGQRPGLVTSYSDVQPAEWYLLHANPLRLEPLIKSRPWIQENDLQPLEPFNYETRDGLMISGYFIRPSKKAEGAKPAVIHIHGGPWVRADSWGYGSFGIAEGQFLASLGYLVVIPNFRGTPGFGNKIYYAGKRQFGREMQDDIEDLTEKFIKDGLMDPGRICLSGASYGGYSSLMGLIKTPDKYRCAISGLAPTDLRLLMTSAQGDIPQNKIALNFWKGMVGDPDKDSAELASVSPINNVEKIKKPVLLYAGGSDIRVPLEQPKRMYDRLRARSNKVEWVMFEDEGHGFGEIKNNVILYKKISEFLAENLK